MIQRIFLVVLFALVLTACGQDGPLYLPKKASDAQSPINQPAPKPSPTPSPSQA